VPPATAENLGDRVVSAWRALKTTSVGAEELLKIQRAVGETVSPANIARELAAAGAELRHPEVIECDADWREKQISERRKRIGRLAGLRKLDGLKLNQAEAEIAELEQLRQSDEHSGVWAELRTFAIDARQGALSRARDSSSSSFDREVQAEIAEWLRVWLETPNLFREWLELRKMSEGFLRQFGDR